jgi:hypothetical protein
LGEALYVRSNASPSAKRKRDILVRLDASATVADMDLPGFRLHPLKGEMKGFWAVTVRANWRDHHRGVVNQHADRLLKRLYEEIISTIIEALPR